MVIEGLSATYVRAIDRPATMLTRTQSSAGSGRASARDGQIRRLQLENTRLQDELALETERARDQSSLETLSEIAQLQEEYIRYQTRLDRDQDAVADLQARIDTLRCELADLQRRPLASTPKLAQQIRISENRLDKALVRYNEAIAFNANLRDAIDALRREWAVHQGTLHRIDAELQQKRDQIALIARQTVQACKAREAAHARLAEIKRDTDLERDKFLELSDELHQKMKEHRRFMDDCLTGRSNLSQTSSRTDDDAVADSRERALLDRVSDLDLGLTERNANLARQADAVCHLESSLQEILDTTGADSIHDLLGTMQISEATNKTLYDDVHQLHTQTIFELERQLDRAKREAALVAAERAAGPDATRARLIEQLQNDLGATLTTTDAEAAKLRQIRAEMDDLRPLLQQILNKLGAEFRHPLNENHFADAMGAIETRVCTIIRRIRNCDDDDDNVDDVHLDDELIPTVSILQLPTVANFDESDADTSSDEGETSPWMPQRR